MSSEAPQKPPMLDNQAYLALVERLLTEGHGVGKTRNVGAFLLRDFKVATETREGTLETERKVKVEPLYVVMDLAHYPLEQQRGMIIKDLAKNWAGKVIRERDLDSPDYRAPGIWLNKQNAVEFDYLPVDPADPTNSERKPNPEASRLCLDLDEGVSIPVIWKESGGFFINAGGTIAVRERDVPKLAEAFQAIRNGEADTSILFSEPGVTSHDIYGMEPNFANGPANKRQYDPVELKPSTRQLMAALKPR